VESAGLLPALLPCLHVACVAGSRSTYCFQLLRVYLQSSIVCTRNSFIRDFLTVCRICSITDCTSLSQPGGLHHTLPFNAFSTISGIFALTCIVLQAMFATYTISLHLATSLCHVHPTRNRRRADSEHHTMQGSPRSSYESRPPPGHLLAQPRQSGSPTRSVRENHAHVVHESSSFGDAGRAKAGGACKCGPLEREFSARSLPDSPDRSGCLSVVRQDDASGELDGRDQNHGVLQQARVARVTAARPRPHTSFQEAGLHRCEMCRLATSEPCVAVLGGGWMRIRSDERTPSALRPEISLPE
jgi:hypothetical protein